MKINDFYLEHETIGQISNVLRSQRYVTLEKFFSKNFLGELMGEIRNLEFEKKSNKILHSFKSSHSVKINKMLAPELANCISKITKRGIKPIKAETRIFEWKDYMIINDKKPEKSGIDILIDLTSDWDESFGGHAVYVDGTGDYTKVCHKFNSITIILKDENTKKFVQYVNNFAKKKKRIMLFIEN